MDVWGRLFESPIGNKTVFALRLYLLYFTLSNWERRTELPPFSKILKYDVSALLVGVGVPLETDVTDHQAWFLDDLRLVVNDCEGYPLRQPSSKVCR
jgi:hypothetical protein